MWHRGPGTTGKWYRPMRTRKNKNIQVTSELTNISLIREAEQAKQEALANAARIVAEKLARAEQEAEKIKEQVIGEARADRKKLVQEAIDLAKSEIKANIEEQKRLSKKMFTQGEKFVGIAADFAVRFILGDGQENME